MKHGPRKILTTLGASALALCASVALASPALADQLPFGCLVFDSPDTIDDIVTMEDGVVTVAGGTAETAITVTQNPSAEVTTDVTKVVIGSEAGDFTGSITFTGIESDTVENGPHALSISVENTEAGGDVTIDDCNLLGSEAGEAAIHVGAASDVTLTIGESAIQGPAGTDGSQDSAGPAVRIDGESTIVATGEVTVKGGTGGAAASASVAPGAGGAGIWAPGATLSMTNGNLTAQAGDKGSGSDIEPSALPVGLTVAAYDLSNGTGIEGGGPQVTAIGWPQENATDLDLSGLDAGTAGTDTFYPWLLQVSTEEDGTGANPYVAAFAGEGLDYGEEPIQREGWRWFNIAPHPVTGLQADALTNTKYDEHAIWNWVNQMDGESDLMYMIGVMPTFGIEGLEDWEVIDGAEVPQSIVMSSDIEWQTVENPNYGPEEWFTLKPGFDAEGITVRGEVQLPEEFTALYPDIAGTVDTTIPVVDVKSVYRLYNPFAEYHLYTTDVNEVAADVAVGWRNEHAYWFAPAEPAGADVVINRLYNPYNGDHYFIESTNTDGIAYLTGLGWIKESPAADIVSLPDVPYETMDVYTLYNPNRDMDTHLYTPLKSELDDCLDDGWVQNDTIIYAYPILDIDPMSA